MRCELCSRDPICLIHQRLCASCAEMIQRLLHIAGGNADISVIERLEGVVFCRDCNTLVKKCAHKTARVGA